MFSPSFSPNEKLHLLPETIGELSVVLLHVVWSVFFFFQNSLLSRFAYVAFRKSKSQNYGELMTKHQVKNEKKSQSDILANLFIFFGHDCYMMTFDPLESLWQVLSGLCNTLSRAVSLLSHFGFHRKRQVRQKHPRGRWMFLLGMSFSSLPMKVKMSKYHMHEAWDLSWALLVWRNPGVPDSGNQTSLSNNPFLILSGTFLYFWTNKSNNLLLQKTQKLCSKLWKVHCKEKGSTVKTLVNAY